MRDEQHYTPNKTYGDYSVGTGLTAVFTAAIVYMRHFALL
jgi:hypothetical protein